MDLIIENVSKFFNNNGSSRTVLKNVCLEVRASEFISLLGPSGCGKTTLLTIIAGFQQPTSGSIFLNGRKVEKPGPDRGFVFQDFALFPWMTVRENILFPMQQQNIPKRRQQERLQQLLEMAQLSGSENLYPSQISGGMKQRTAVSRALASDPEVLLMDEPFGAVDYQMRQQLQEELESLWLKNRKPVIMVTHDVAEAIFLSDRVWVMSPINDTIHDIHIEVERPRPRKHEQYHLYRDKLADMLQNLKNG